MPRSRAKTRCLKAYRRRYRLARPGVPALLTRTLGRLASGRDRAHDSIVALMPGPKKALENKLSPNANYWVEKP